MKYPKCQKTKEWMKNALLDLIDEKPYSKISIVELANRAGVNRKTFYDHYESIDVLYEEILSEMLYKTFAAYDDYHGSCASEENYRNTLITFVENVRHTGKAAKVFCSDQAPQYVLRIIKNKLDRNTRGTAIVQGGKELDPMVYDIFQEAQANFMYAMVRSAVQWCDTHSSEEIVDAMLEGWGAYDIFMQDYAKYYKNTVDWHVRQSDYKK